MACKNFLKSRLYALWSVLFAVAFLSCSLIIYYRSLHYGKICSKSTGCSTSSVIQAAEQSNEKCREMCTTDECLEIANTLISNMDASADPCEDFFTFACGHFVEEHGQEDNYASLDLLKERLFTKVRDVIETSEETRIADSAAQKLKIFYDSCMDTGSGKLAETRTLQLFLNEVGITNWPLLDLNFRFSNPTLEEVLGRLGTFEENIFVDFFPENIFDESDENLNMTVRMPSRNKDLKLELKNLNVIMTDILGYTGMHDNDIKQTWESFMEVEDIILELRKTSKEVIYCDDKEEALHGGYLDCNKEKTQNMSILCKILESMNRQEGLSSRFNTDGVKIKCYTMNYLTGVSSFLESHNHRALAHYIALRVFINNLKYMDFSIRRKILSFFKEPGMSFMDDPYVLERKRWKFCVSFISNYMKFPLAFMYVPEMLPPEAINELDDIFHEYRNVTLQLWEAQGSISDDAKMEIKYTISFQQNKLVSNIKMFTNRSFVNSLYEQFHPSLEKNFLLNVMYHKKREFISKNPNIMEEYRMRHISMFSVQASGGNAIDLMFGVLLPPIFKYGYPKLFNIAQIGEIIGHEFGHSVFEVLGYFKGENQTNFYFDGNNKCRADQYSKFELKRIGRTVKGNQTMNENFSDNMSTKVSEEVAKSLLRNMTETMFALPGFDLSPEQLFYIYYAQAWCSVTSTHMEWELYEKDVHSPAKFRPIGILQTSARFSEVFNCPTTSYMNPQEKCPVFN